MKWSEDEKIKKKEWGEEEEGKEQQAKPDEKEEEGEEERNGQEEELEDEGDGAEGHGDLQNLEVSLGEFWQMSLVFRSDIHLAVSSAWYNTNIRFKSRSRYLFYFENSEWQRHVLLYH